MNGVIIISDIYKFLDQCKQINQHTFIRQLSKYSFHYTMQERQIIIYPPNQTEKLDDIMQLKISPKKKKIQEPQSPKTQRLMQLISNTQLLADQATNVIFNPSPAIKVVREFEDHIKCKSFRDLGLKMLMYITLIVTKYSLGNSLILSPKLANDFRDLVLLSTKAKPCTKMVEYCKDACVKECFKEGDCCVVAKFKDFKCCCRDPLECHCSLKSEKIDESFVTWSKEFLDANNIVFPQFLGLISILMSCQCRGHTHCGTTDEQGITIYLSYILCRIRCKA